MKFPGKTFFAFLVIILLHSCDDRIKRNRSNKFYSLLVNKDWAEVTNDDAIRFNAPILKFKRLNVSIDSIKKSTSKFFDSIRRTRQERIDSTPSEFYALVLPVLIFDSAGGIKYDLYTRHVSLCGNGLLGLKSGEWSFEGNNIILDIYGHYFLEGNFHNKIEYQILFSDSNNMQLKLIKVLESEFKKGL